MFVRKLNLGVPVAVAAMFAVVLPASAQTSLLEGFKEPPNIARPRVYWYWPNGNITKEGLTKDLEWMHRAGIDGVETFDVTMATPNVEGLQVRRNNGVAERGGTPAALYAAGLEGCVPPCASGGGQAGHDDDHRSRAWMEPDGRALGEAGRRDEEVCLDRDGSGGRQARAGHAAEAAGSEWAVWGSSASWKGRGDPADPVQGPDGDRVSRAGGGAGAGTSASGCDIQWREFRLRRSHHAYLRQSGGFAGGGGQGILDSDWVRHAADGAWGGGRDTVW